MWQAFRSVPLAKWRFFWLWIAFSAAGWAVWLGVGNRFGLTIFLFGPGVVFLGEWLLLRARLPRAGWWVPLSIVGVWAGFAFGALLGSRLQDALDHVAGSPPGIAALGPGRSFVGWIVGTAATGAAVGSGVGVAQWFVLRTRSPVAAWWPPLNALAFGLAMLLSSSLAFLPAQLVPQVDREVGAAVSGAVVGLVSGAIRCLPLERYLSLVTR